MSRGYDGPEIDDFRDSGSGWGRDTDRDPSSDWNSRFALHNIHRKEDRADRRDTEGRERGDKARPPVPREERVRQILSQRVRTKYTDRNRQYSLRDSETNTLGEVGKFRVVGLKEALKLIHHKDKDFQAWLSGQHTKTSEPTSKTVSKGTTLKRESFQLELK